MSKLSRRETPGVTMSLPDLLKDVDSASCGVRNPSISSKGSKLESCKSKRSRSGSQRETSSSPDFEWETDSIHSFDEGEATWDALGRMSSIRRSNRFDKPQLLTVELRRDHEGFGLELEGKAPPIIHAVSKYIIYHLQDLFGQLYNENGC